MSGEEGLLAGRGSEIPHIIGAIRMRSSPIAAHHRAQPRKFFEGKHWARTRRGVVLSCFDPGRRATLKNSPFARGTGAEGWAA